MDLKELGNKIKAARLEKGLTMEELGQKIGTKKEGVFRIESGKQNVCVKTLTKISEALGSRLIIDI